jgi:hypothetical protein
MIAIVRAIVLSEHAHTYTSRLMSSARTCGGTCAYIHLVNTHDQSHVSLLASTQASTDQQQQQQPAASSQQPAASSSSSQQQQQQQHQQQQQQQQQQQSFLHRYMTNGSMCAFEKSTSVVSMLSPPGIRPSSGARVYPYTINVLVFDVRL